MVSGQVGVGADLEGLVVAESTCLFTLNQHPPSKTTTTTTTFKTRSSNKPVIMESNHPPSLLIQTLLALPNNNLVANNLQTIRLLFTQKVSQQRPDHGLHATAQDNDRHVVLLGPVEELLEAGIQGDVLQQSLDALVKGRADAVQHLLEAVAEVAVAEQHVLVPLLAQRRAEPQVVSHEVVAVLLRDGAVEVGEEDEFGVGGHGWQGGG